MDSAKESFTVTEAANALSEMERFEEGLRRRTEGVTWMIWGFVITGLFLSFFLVQFEESGPMANRYWPWAGLLPVLALLLAGAATSLAVWRGAALHSSVGARQSPTRRAAGLLGVFAAFVVVLLMVMGFVNTRFATTEGDAHMPAVPLAILGVFDIILGAVNVLRLSKAGRQTIIGIGIAQIAGGVLLAVLRPEEVLAWYLIALIAGGSFIGGGLHETLRG